MPAICGDCYGTGELKGEPCWECRGTGYDGPPANACEHCAGPALGGKRFCCKNCERCEHESKNEATGCDGICDGSLPPPAPEGETP
jgi:hypothetical protein